MYDGYDFMSAMKAVDRAMPEEAKLIRKYIETLKAKLPSQLDENKYEDEERISSK